MAKGRLLKTKVKEVKALLKAELETRAKFEAKQFSSIKGIKKHIASFIARLDPTDLVIFSGLILFYSQAKKHPYLQAFIEASFDLGLLKSQSDIGVGAAIAHIGLEALGELLKDAPKLIVPSQVPFTPKQPLLVPVP